MPPLDDVETGSIIPFAGVTLPAGYLWCDGAAVSRVTYSALFAAIGVAYGVGDGSTTFNVPDLRGRSPMGSGTGPGLSARARGDSAGVEAVQLTDAQSGLPGHGHAVTDLGHTHNTAIGTVQSDVSGNSTTLYTDGGPTDTSSNTTGLTVTAVAGASAAQSHPNVHPVTVCGMIIKT